MKKKKSSLPEGQPILSLQAIEEGYTLAIGSYGRLDLL